MREPRLLSEIDELAPDEVGGKAARLAVLCRAGLPVPAGFAIPVAWYERWLAPVQATSAAAPEAVREAIANLPVPADLAEAVQAALARLGAQPSDRWAVRSSAVGEDDTESSFAGQGESYLDVPAADIPARVVACWRSGWSRRALAYRERLGGDGAMGVLVQRMVSPSVAGIAFSRDPLNGEDVVVVEAVAGLGDELAQGRGTPHRYLVRGERVDSPEGGPLSRAALARVVQLAREAETLLGWPVDIEWAIADGEVWLLQARPLTGEWATDFYTTPDEDDALWTAGFVNERFPTLVSPLGWSVIQKPFENLALREPLSFLGHPEAWRGRVTKLYQGHPYIAVEAVASIYKLLPDFLLPEDVARYFPDGQVAMRKQARYPRSWADLRFWRAALGTLWREAANLSPLHNPGRWRRCRAEYTAKLVEVERALPGATDAAACLVLLDVVEKANARLLAVHRWSLTHADLWYTLLRRLGRLTLGPDWAGAVAALVRGAEEVTVVLDRKLRRLASELPPVPETRAALASAVTVEDLAARLPAGPESSRFIAGLRRFLDTYGHRSFSLDIAQPSFAADPRQVFSLLLAFEEEVAAEPEEAAVHVSRGWRLLLAPFVAVARRYLALREEQRFYWQRGLALMRALYLRLGKHLAEAGRLDCAEDVFYLTAEEVEALAGGRGPANSRRLAAWRRREFAALVAGQLVNPVRAYPPFLRGKTPLAAAQVGESTLLRGTPVSAGLACGVVHVVRDPAELGTVRQGEVLVAASVDPGWTPVFGKLAALVTECGGQLSHPAVVAREYGLPAVLGVPGASFHLRTGDRVLVDGAAGTVTLL